MDFERHKDGKEALGVGLRANALTINNFYVLKTDIIQHRADNGLVIGLPNRSPMIIYEPKTIWQILEMVAKGTLTPSDFCFDIIEPDSVMSSKMFFLRDLRGRYVRYIARSINPSSEPDDFIGTEGLFLIPEKNDV